MVCLESGEAQETLHETLHLGVKRARRFMRGLRHVLNPMLCAMMGGIFVGLISFFRESLFSPGSMCAFLGDALKQLGAPAPVIGLQILGGTLGIAVQQFGDLGSLKTQAGLLRPGQRTWMVVTIAGKLLLMPLLGFLAFSMLCGLKHFASMAVPTSSMVLPTTSHAEPIVDVLARVGNAVWPQDKLLRAIVVMQWAAPTCLNLVVLSNRAGLDDDVLQAVSALYLAMYATTIVATTFWVSAGIAIF